MNPPVAGYPRHALQPGTLPVLVVFFAETKNFITLDAISGEKVLNQTPGWRRLKTTRKEKTDSGKRERTRSHTEKKKKAITHPRGTA
jgi:hypothetical protein